MIADYLEGRRKPHRRKTRVCWLARPRTRPCLRMQSTTNNVETSGAEHLEIQVRARKELDAVAAGNGRAGGSDRAQGQAPSRLSGPTPARSLASFVLVCRDAIYQGQHHIAVRTPKKLGREVNSFCHQQPKQTAAER